MDAQKIEVDRSQYGRMQVEVRPDHEDVAFIDGLSDLHGEGIYRLGSLNESLREHGIDKVVVSLTGLPAREFTEKLLLLGWLGNFDAGLDFFGLDARYLSPEAREFRNTGTQVHICKRMYEDLEAAAESF
jgi:hypothetical protein